MQARNLVVASLIVVWGLGAAPVASAQSVPAWTVGDTWQVGVWQGQAYIQPGSRAATSQAYNPRGRMVAVAFRVAGISKVGATECFEVEITFPREDTGFHRRYQAYYAKDTGKLVRIRDISVTRGGTVRNAVTDFAPGPAGPTAVTDVASLVPLDWPDWTQEDVAAPAEGTHRTSQSTTHPTVQSADGGSQQQDEITLTTLAGQKETKVVQTWTKGQPWWTEAKKYDGGQLVAEAVLLEVNGQKIALNNTPSSLAG